MKRETKTSNSSSLSNQNSSNSKYDRLVCFLKKNRKIIIWVLVVTFFLLLILLLWLNLVKGKGGGGQDTDQFTEDCVIWHNTYRAKHGVKKVSVNSEIASFALTRAEKLVQLGRLEHLPGNRGYGENLYVHTSKGIDCKDVTESWYNEFKEYNYDFENPKWDSQCGHATQVVWASTDEIGCARKLGEWSGRESQYVVCMYSPAGNMIGQFKENVLPPV